MQIKHKPDGKTNELEIIPIDELAEVRGWKALGSKLNYPKLVEVIFLETEEEALATEKTPDAPEPVEIEEVEETNESQEESQVESVSDEPEAPAEVISDEPEFVVNFPEETKVEEKPSVEEKKEDDIPFEIKNPPKGEQLGLF